MMSDQIDRDFADQDDARAKIGAAVSYLLEHATGSSRGDIVREIIESVQAIANGTPAPRYHDPAGAPAANRPAISGTTYKAYVIDAFRRDADNWRSTIRRLDGKKIRVAVPPAVVDETTISADALTAEKAIDFARKLIDGGGLI